MNHKSGYSLITIMVATAIASISMAAVLFLVDMISRTVARSNAEENIESAVRTAQGIVANRDLCNNALRGADASDKIEFAPVGCGVTEVPVARLYLQNQDNQPNSTLVLTTGGTIGFGYRVRRMVLRERVPCQGRGDIVVNSIQMKTYAAELLLDFEGDGGRQTLGAMRTRAIPISVVTHPGPDNNLNTPDDYVDRCYQDSSAQYMCEQLGGSYSPGGGCTAILRSTNMDCRTQLTGTPEDCPDSTPDGTNLPTNVRCQNFYYVVGFDSADPNRQNARPICKCQRICRQYTGPNLPANPGSASGSAAAGGTWGTSSASGPSDGGGGTN